MVSSNSVNDNCHARLVQERSSQLRLQRRGVKRFTDSDAQKCLRLSFTLLCIGLFCCVRRMETEERGKRSKAHGGRWEGEREKARVRSSLFPIGEILVHQRIRKPPFSSVWQRDWSLRQKCPFWEPFSKKCVFGAGTKG